MRPLSGRWLLLRSHGAPKFLVASAVLTLVGCALGPDSRSVITRDGALGEPLPFVVALTGVAAMVCLTEPCPELSGTMPRPRWQARAVRVGFVAAGCTAAVGLSGLVAPGLTAATARNVLIAVTVTLLMALWRPLLAWVPTSAYLILSWFRGTATADDAARAWAVPAQPPNWPITGAFAAAALVAAVVWVAGNTITRALSGVAAAAPLRRRRHGSGKGPGVQVGSHRTGGGR